MTARNYARRSSQQFPAAPGFCHCRGTGGKVTEGAHQQMCTPAWLCNPNPEKYDWQPVRWQAAAAAAAKNPVLRLCLFKRLPFDTSASDAMIHVNCRVQSWNSTQHMYLHGCTRGIRRAWRALSFFQLLSRDSRRVRGKMRLNETNGEEHKKRERKKRRRSHLFLLTPGETCKDLVPSIAYRKESGHIFKTM